MILCIECDASKSQESAELAYDYQSCLFEAFFLHVQKAPVCVFMSRDRQHRRMSGQEFIQIRRINNSSAK